MTWEYLLEKKLDKRCEYIASKLKISIKDSIIVDIDCMHAPLLKYIPDTYKKYIGNDILSVFPKNKKTEFLQIDDKYLLGELRNITDKVDIVVAIGIGGYEISKEERESKTLTNTIIEVCLRYNPKILVLEAVTKYTPILDIILAEIPYTIKHEATLDLGNDWVEKRQIYICQRV